MKKWINILIRGILAGISISIGGFLYIRSGDFSISRILPSFLFPIGLILICNFDFYLYTGKICYLPQAIKEKSTHQTLISLLIGLFGNFIGTVVMGIILRVAITPSSSSYNIVLNKLNHEWYQVIILSIFCGMLIYFAVEGFKKIQNQFGKYIVLILCISGFILCGFEHSIANMFYIFYTNTISLKSLLFIVLVIIGNTIGGIAIQVLNSLKD